MLGIGSDRSIAGLAATPMTSSVAPLQQQQSADGNSSCLCLSSNFAACEAVTFREAHDPALGFSNPAAARALPASAAAPFLSFSPLRNGRPRRLTCGGLDDARKGHVEGVSPRGPSVVPRLPWSIVAFYLWAFPSRSSRADLSAQGLHPAAP